MDKAVNLTKIDPAKLAPPMLAQGSFHPATGVGCVMNLMCWVKKYPIHQVDDEPDGVAEAIRDLLVELNDNMCFHLRPHTFKTKKQFDHAQEFSTKLNCPKCSSKLISWAFDFADSKFIEAGLEDANYADPDDELEETSFTPDEARKLNELYEKVAQIRRDHQCLLSSYGGEIYDAEASQKVVDGWSKHQHEMAGYDVDEKIEFKATPAGVVRELTRSLVKLETAMEKLIDFYFVLYRKHGIKPSLFAWENEQAQAAIDAAIKKYRIKTGPEVTVSEPSKESVK